MMLESFLRLHLKLRQILQQFSELCRTGLVFPILAEALWRRPGAFGHECRSAVSDFMIWAYVSMTPEKVADQEIPASNWENGRQIKQENNSI
jgi:hypothetical protein